MLSGSGLDSLDGKKASFDQNDISVSILKTVK